MIPCKHWSSNGTTDSGHCDLARHVDPKHEYCLNVCPLYSGKSRGLGDDIKRVTSAVGIKPCNGCGKRQLGYNQKRPRKWVKEALEAE